jgi:hypothetical protein
MAWFQPDPQSIADRARAAGVAVRPPTLAESMLRGIVGFALISLAGFAPWAFCGGWFYPRVGEVGLYATCAAVFIGLSGVALHRLIIGPGSLSRFYKLFGLGFAAYSVGWIGCWMGIGGDKGSMAGLLCGTAAMGVIFAWAFDARCAALRIVGALFVPNAAGYFLGGWIEWRLGVHHLLGAMLLWGVLYGIGFGAGLGMAFYLCQTEARARIG